MKYVADGILGQDCALCGTRSDASLVCGECHAALPRPEPERRVVSPFQYRFPVDRLVQRFKFGGDLALGRWLAMELAERTAGESRPDLVVATPLSTARLRKRGFNQALQIARVVAKQNHWPLAARALVRVRDTPAQHLLSRAARRRNLRGAFRCDASVEGMRIALVDDVVTTGATVDALARLLMRHGAKEVAIWAVARTPAPRAR